MNLLNLSDADKVKAFNMIVKEYQKDGSIEKFGHDVQDILIFLKKMNEFNK
jgi:hypothetical protein